MAKNAIQNDFGDHPDNSKELKKYYKMVLAPSMSLEEKQDELWHLPKNKLLELLEMFQADEEYEICHAIQTTIDESIQFKKKEISDNYNNLKGRYRIIYNDDIPILDIEGDKRIEFLGDEGFLLLVNAQVTAQDFDVTLDAAIFWLVKSQLD